MVKATATRRNLTEATNESPHFEQKNHIIFSNLLAKLVSNSKYIIFEFWHILEFGQDYRLSSS